MERSQLPTGLDVESLDRKIRVLTLPVLSDVKTVKTAYENILFLMEGINKHVKKETDGAMVRALQRRYLMLEREKVRCGEILDSKGFFLFASSTSLQQELDHISTTKNELNRRLAELTNTSRSFFGSSRGSISAGTANAAQGAPHIGPTLLKMSSFSTSGASHQQQLPLDAIPLAGEFLVEKSSHLFQAAHQLLLSYEQLIKIIYKKYPIVSAASPQLDSILSDLKKEAAQAITLMRRILGSPLPTHMPRSPHEACLGCRAVNDFYCGNCSTRFQRQCDKLALKLCGNKLINMDSQKARMTVEQGSLDLFLHLENLKAEVLVKEQRAAELSKKIAAVKASIAAKRAQLEERDKLCARLAENNRRLRENIEKRSATISQLEDAAGKAKISRDLTESQLAAVRRDKVSKLFSIMPVFPHPDKPGRTTFLNILLREDCTVEPSAHEHMDQELTAVVLGALVRLLQNLGKYLNVHYPFFMLFNGSQSVIWRYGSPNRYILSEIRSASLDDFRVALQRLHWNVYYLCFSQGLVIEGQGSERRALRNLRLLLEHAVLLGFELRTPDRFVLISDKEKPVAIISKAPASPGFFGTDSNTIDSGIYPPVKASDVSSPGSRRQSLDAPKQSEDDQSEPPTEDDKEDDFEDFEILHYQPPRPDDPDALKHHDRAHADQASDSTHIAATDKEKDDVYML